MDGGYGTGGGIGLVDGESSEVKGTAVGEGWLLQKAGMASKRGGLPASEEGGDGFWRSHRLLKAWCGFWKGAPPTSDGEGRFWLLKEVGVTSEEASEEGARDGFWRSSDFWRHFWWERLLKMVRRDLWRRILRLLMMVRRDFWRRRLPLLIGRALLASERLLWLLTGARPLMGARASEGRPPLLMGAVTSGEAFWLLKEDAPGFWWGAGFWRGAFGASRGFWGRRYFWRGARLLKTRLPLLMGDAPLASDGGDAAASDGAPSFWWAPGFWRGACFLMGARLLMGQPLWLLAGRLEGCWRLLGGRWLLKRRPDFWWLPFYFIFLFLLDFYFICFYICFFVLFYNDNNNNKRGDNNNDNDNK